MRHRLRIALSFNLQQQLLSLLSSVSWTVKGIILQDDAIIPVPAESRAVTAILQSIAVRKLKEWADKNDIKFEDLVYETRGYPDTALSGGTLGNKLIALDIKSARYLPKGKVSRMTLGTYDGYFLHPNEKRLQSKTRSYNDYDEHWVVGFIYRWNPDLETNRMVKIEKVIVGEKWQVASKYSGSGDTANMGGLDSLDRLENLQSDFSDEDEFETYWRKYAVDHPRKNTRAPED